VHAIAEISVSDASLEEGFPSVLSPRRTVGPTPDSEPGVEKVGIVSSIPVSRESVLRHMVYEITVEVARA
jgi:hypothetical protein